MWGLVGAVLVVQTDSSRKDLRYLSFTHLWCINLSLKELPSAVIVACRGVGLLHQQLCQLVHHPALSHRLHWVKRPSQDGAGHLDKFIQSFPTCCRGAAAPADHFIENGWCHHGDIERGQEWPLHCKGPELPQQMESALTFLICRCSVISPVQHVTITMSAPWMFTCVHGANLQTWPNSDWKKWEFLNTWKG